VLVSTKFATPKMPQSKALYVSYIIMNILFVCTENKLRSATAEAVFSSYPNVVAIGAGTNKDAETPVSGDLIEWADAILVMEKFHKVKISSKYGDLLKDKKVSILAIQDNYGYMDVELVKILEKRVPKYVPIQKYV